MLRNLASTLFLLCNKIALMDHQARLMKHNNFNYYTHLPSKSQYCLLFTKTTKENYVKTFKIDLHPGKVFPFRSQ